MELPDPTRFMEINKPHASNVLVAESSVTYSGKILIAFPGLSSHLSLKFK